MQAAKVCFWDQPEGMVKLFVGLILSATFGRCQYVENIALEFAYSCREFIDRPEFDVSSPFWQFFRYTRQNFWVQLRYGRRITRSFF